MCACSASQWCLTVISWAAAARLLCPWDSAAKNTGVGSPSLLQGIFLTQGSNLRLLHWQANSLPVSHLGRPLCCQWGNHFCKRELRNNTAGALVAKLPGAWLRDVWVEWPRTVVRVHSDCSDLSSCPQFCLVKFHCLKRLMSSQNRF